MKTPTIAVSLMVLVATSVGAQEALKRDFKAYAKERFQELDVNRDGAITHDELMQQARQKFSEFDQDGNGIVLLEELPEKMPLSAKAQRRMERMQERREARQEEGKRAPARSLEAFAEKHQPSRIKFMARFDKNGDEQLVVEEFAAPMIKRHKKIDVNGDGTVTEMELDEALERGMRHKRRGNNRNMR